MAKISQGVAPEVITCKAAVAWKSSEPLVVEDIQVDPPKSTEVRIKMLYASMCHTDYVFWSPDFPLPFFPRILGHEGVGVIESVGDKVTNLKVGDNVMPLYLAECGECSNCKSGKTNICNKYGLNLSGLMEDGSSRMSVKGQKIYHFFTCSTWSEYTVIESDFVVKVDPKMPQLSHASLLSCGFTTGYGAAWKELKVEKGSTATVLGLGSVGLGAAKACQILGATRIFGVDINEMRRDKAKAFGVTDFINPKLYGKSTSELIKEATEGLGVDYCFECTGNPSLLNEALACTKPGLGQVAYVSAASKGREVNLSLLTEGRSLKGTYFGGVKIHSDLPKIVQKCVKKEIDLDELITHEISLAEINKGFLEYTKQPSCVKVIIKF